MSNVFIHDSAAERYARGRTFFHPSAIDQLADLPGIRGGLGLDLGCGTGLSSRALAGLCRRVIGMDPSRSMIERAAPSDRVDYVVATAESVPSRAASFDVITLCQVAHWLDWKAFLSEAGRVVRPKGWVVVYDHYFDLDAVDANARFGVWLHQSYGERYPRPARHMTPVESPGAWDAGGFRLRHQERYETSVNWSHEELIDYLTTQSKVIAAMEDGDESMAQARSWLARETSDLFTAAPTPPFAFSGPILYAQRRA